MFGFKKKRYEFLISYSYKVRSGVGYGCYSPIYSKNKHLSSEDIRGIIDIISDDEEIKPIIEGKIVITFIKRLRT